MSSDNELKVKITSDATGLKSASQEASDAFDLAVKKITGSVGDFNSLFSRLGGMLAGALSISAIKSSIKSSIDAIKEETDTVRSLQRVMGSTAQEAKVLSVALDLIGASADTFVSVNMKLDMQLKKNESALNQLGIVTRDSNGNLLDQTTLFNNAIKTMGEYKEGADRNMFALFAFGRGAAEVQKFMLLNNETMNKAKEIAAQYGMVVTDQSIAATKKMTMELNVANIVWKETKERIGADLLPVLSALSSELGNTSGVMIVVTGAAKGLITFFDAMILTVKMAGSVIQGVLMGIYYTASSVGNALIKIVHGDFKGAWDLLKQGQKNASDAMRISWDNIIADAEKANKRLKQIWVGTEIGGAVEEPKKVGTKSFVTPDTSGESNQLAIWRQQLEQMKIDENAYFSFSIDREKAFWESKLSKVKQGSKEWYEIKKQIYELSAKAEQQAIINEEKRLDTEMQTAEMAVNIKKKELDAKYQMGQISAEKQINGEIALTDELYAKQVELLEKEKALAEKYPRLWQDVQDKIKKIQQKHNEEIQQLNLKLATETTNSWRKFFNPITNSFTSALTEMIKGTQTFRKSLQQIFTAILNSFLNVIGKMVENWLIGEIQKLGFSKMFSAALVALGITTSAETAAAKSAIEVPAAIKTITTNAATAASGAASSQASIPYVGPYLAAAAAAAMLGMVLGYSSMVSAAGGYDIPAGVNPLVQTHEKEMILPAHIAEGFRNIIGRGRTGGNTVYNIHALDTRSFASREGATLLRGIKKHIRNMHVRF